MPATSPAKASLKTIDSTAVKAPTPEISTTGFWLRRIEISMIAKRMHMATFTTESMPLIGRLYEISLVWYTALKISTILHRSTMRVMMLPIVEIFGKGSYISAKNINTPVRSIVFFSKAREEIFFKISTVDLENIRVLITLRIKYITVAISAAIRSFNMPDKDA